MKKFLDNNCLNILLIEDGKSQTEFIRAILNSGMIETFQLQCADTLATGLNLLSANKFDIILLDLNLPDSEKMDTFIRVHNEVPHLPIIIMSGIDDNTFAHNAVQMGAQDYLVKGKISSHNLSRSIHYALERKRIEDALIESKEQWRSLIENSPDIILNVDHDGKIKFINRVLPGQPSQEQTIGMNVIDFVPPEHHKRHEEAFMFVFETGKEKSYESQAVGPNGSTSWYICRAVPIKHGSQVLSVNLIVTDITERKKTEIALKESEQLFRSITTSAQDAIVMFDNNSNVSFWNSAAEKIFGYTQDEILGKELNKILDSEIFYSHYIIYHELKSHNYNKKGFTHFKKTGTETAIGKLLEITGKRKDGTEII